MPVELQPRFRPDDLEQSSASDARANEAEREATAAAFRCAAGWSLPAGVVSILAVFALRHALSAATEELKAGGDHWVMAFMPTVLLGILGLIIGGLVGWRLVNATGVGGRTCWVAATGSGAAAAACGAVGAVMAFADAPPLMCWIALAAMTATASLAGAYFAFASVD